MSQAGIEVNLDDAEYRNIIDALHRASHCDLKRIAQAAGLALQAVTAEAFKKQEDPVRGDKWEALKAARGPLAARPGSKTPILNDRGTLKKSITFHAFDDGSVIIGSTLQYSKIHQQGGVTKAHTIKPHNAGVKALRFNGRFFKSVKHPGSKIPARPFLGVPKDFQESFFSDPAIKKLLGIAIGEE